MNIVFPFKAPFNQWHLREDYKRVNRRKELAESMKTYIIILGCINLILMPVILLWQILYSFFNYAQIIKREPGSLGVRKGNTGGLGPYSRALPLVARYTRRLSLAESGGGRLAEDRSRRASTEGFEEDYRHEE